MKIYGKIITDSKEWGIYYGIMGVPGCKYYALGVRKATYGLARSDDEHGIAGCSGKANQLLGKQYYNPTDTMSWGFEGNGSDLMAAWLIAEALYYEEHGHTMGESFEHCYSHPEHYERVLPLMNRHYKQFSTEVIANLPDEWEMDTEWVKQWINEREAKA